MGCEHYQGLAGFCPQCQNLFNQHSGYQGSIGQSEYIKQRQLDQSGYQCPHQQQQMNLNDYSDIETHRKLQILDSRLIALEALCKEIKNLLEGKNQKPSQEPPPSVL